MVLDDLQKRFIKVLTKRGYEPPDILKEWELKFGGFGNVEERNAFLAQVTGYVTRFGNSIIKELPEQVKTGLCNKMVRLKVRRRIISKLIHQVEIATTPSEKLLKELRGWLNDLAKEVGNFGTPAVETPRGVTFNQQFNLNNSPLPEDKTAISLTKEELIQRAKDVTKRIEKMEIIEGDITVDNDRVSVVRKPVDSSVVH